MNIWTFANNITCTVLVFIFVFTGHLSAQESGSSDKLIPLYDNLGNYSRMISTDSELAQAYFDQGLRLAYSFARAEAAESFRSARQHDPDCAMCYWGEAWVLGPYQNNPAGELAAADGRYADAEQYLREAVRLEDSLPYSEPEPWVIPPRQVLGAVLVEAGLAADAEAVYREDLNDHPGNGWSLFGLMQCLDAQGKSSESEKVRRDFEKAWERSDVYLKASRF